MNKKINKYQEDHPGETNFFQAFFLQLHIYTLHILIISKGNVLEKWQQENRDAVDKSKAIIFITYNFVQ